MCKRSIVFSQISRQLVRLAIEPDHRFSFRIEPLKLVSAGVVGPPPGLTRGIGDGGKGGLWGGHKPLPQSLAQVA